MKRSAGCRRKGCAPPRLLRLFIKGRSGVRRANRRNALLQCGAGRDEALLALELRLPANTKPASTWSFKSTHMLSGAASRGTSLALPAASHKSKPRMSLNSGVQKTLRAARTPAVMVLTIGPHELLLQLKPVDGSHTQNTRWNQKRSRTRQSHHAKRCAILAGCVGFDIGSGEGTSAPLRGKSPSQKVLNCCVSHVKQQGRSNNSSATALPETQPWGLPQRAQKGSSRASVFLRNENLAANYHCLLLRRRGT